MHFHICLRSAERGSGEQSTEEEIIDLFYFKFQDIPLLSRMEAVAENFIDEVETLRDNDMDEEEREMLLDVISSVQGVK